MYKELDLKATLRHLASRLIPKTLRIPLFKACLEGMESEQKNNVCIWYDMASMEWSLRNIKRLGFEPENIVDVGAYQGHWTEMAKRIFPDSHVLMLEAQSSKEEFLEKVCRRYANEVSYEICLLGRETKSDVPFHMMETGSSVLREKSNIESVVTLSEMTTLDQVTTKKMQGKVDLLKLDVQGYELEVLKGGLHSLQDAEVVLMEVSVIKMNTDAPLMSKVIEFMNEYQFVPYDICSLMRRPLDNALCQTDILFVKSNSTLLQYQDYSV